MEEEKEYKGVWRDIGCILSALALIGIATFIGVLLYQFFSN